MALVIEKGNTQEYNQKEHRESLMCLSPEERMPLLARITICWPTSILYIDQRFDMLWGLQHDTNPS